VVSSSDVTVSTTPLDSTAAANALVNAGYTDSSTGVDTSTGLPLYVASATNPNPITPAAWAATYAPPNATTTISPMLIAGGVGLLVLVVAMGGRRR